MFPLSHVWWASILMYNFYIDQKLCFSVCLLRRLLFIIKLTEIQLSFEYFLTIVFFVFFMSKIRWLTHENLSMSCFGHLTLCTSQVEQQILKCTFTLSAEQMYVFHCKMCNFMSIYESVRLLSNRPTSASALKNIKMEEM